VPAPTPGGCCGATAAGSACAGAAAAKADPPRGYVVQLGVFSSPQNAEALQRKLTEAGVQTSTETRVLIGPFRDRAEAERSMETVRKLGLGAVVMPARP
jgi:DedD protein